MFNVAICCDEINQMSILSNFLANFSSDHNFDYRLFSFASFDDLVNNPPNHIDILLLNINLNNRYSFLKTYRQLSSLYSEIQVIFIPEIVDFMINGFYLKDFNYILKPLEYSLFENEFLLCIENSGIKDEHFKKIQCLKSNLNILDGIPTKSILSIESKGDKCIAYTNNCSIAIDYNIDMLEKNLNSSDFFRCHNNHLINLLKINKLNRTSVIINTKTIPVSANKFKELKNKLLFMLKII